MLKYLTFGLQAVVLTASLVATPTQAADAQQGARVFEEECSDCHSVTPGRNKKGPSLAGVVGRPSGSISNYKYSDGMKALNVTWDAEHIDAYLAAPKKIVPGGKMKYAGLADGQARTDLLAFLATHTHH
jgi:cytochrome c